ncbi:MAG: hypothetical protein P4L35_07805 [Ignavibacteriaceae bacterium]|nr:hypothetical protein [Ignavibacteriaceae bacterium]
MKLKLSKKAGSKKHSHKGPYHGKLSKTLLKQFFVKSGVHPKIIKHLHASGWFDSILKGIKIIAPQIIKHAPQIIKTATTAYDGYKQNGLQGAVTGAIGSLGGGKKTTKRVMSMSPARKAHIAKMKQRGALISAYMKKHGCKLGEASKAISGKKAGSKKHSKVASKKSSKRHSKKHSKKHSKRH